MLRLPAPGEETPPLVVEGAAKRGRSHSAMRREHRAEEIFDETFANKTGPDPIFFRMLIAAVVTLAIALTVGLFWPRGGGDVGVDGAGTDEPSLPLAEPEVDEEPEVISVAMVRDELEPIVRSFLEAPDLETAARWTARPGRTLERMEKHHRDGYTPPGLGAVLWNQSMSRGRDWASFRVETGDYERKTVFLVKDGGWKVDWESWTGWSPVSWETLKEERPTEPVRVRALVRPVEYYNFGFSSETEWAACMLVAPDGESSIYGYVPRTSDRASRLTFLDGTTERRLILDIRYPENAPAGNQVIIDAVIGEDWLDTEDMP